MFDDPPSMVDMDWGGLIGMGPKGQKASTQLPQKHQDKSKCIKTSILYLITIAQKPMQMVQICSNTHMTQTIPFLFELVPTQPRLLQFFDIILADKLHFGEPG